jgi:hypothetical protein
MRPAPSRIVGSKAEPVSATVQILETVHTCSAIHRTNPVRNCAFCHGFGCSSSCEAAGGCCKPCNLLRSNPRILFNKKCRVLALPTSSAPVLSTYKHCLPLPHDLAVRSALQRLRRLVVGAVEGRVQLERLGPRYRILLPPGSALLCSVRRRLRLSCVRCAAHVRVAQEGATFQAGALGFISIQGEHYVSLLWQRLVHAT